MKKLLIFQFLLCFFLHYFALAHVELGKETIEPLRFPKFTVGCEYAVFRNFMAFNGSNIKKSIDNSFGFNLYAEAGLLKFFNAGLSVSFSKAAEFLKGSNLLRMGLFIKPYLPLGSRVSIFSRIGLGPAIALFNEIPTIRGDEFLYTYGGTYYWPLSAGLNGQASVGLEVFITSRIALVAEYGIRADMLWAKATKDPEHPSNDLTSSGQPAPNWFHYFIYDMPIMLSLNIIL